MTESPERPASGDTRAAGTAPRVRPPMPRWVKAFLVVVLIVVIALVISQLLGIQHGPGMHGALGTTDISAAASAMPSVVTSRA